MTTATLSPPVDFTEIARQLRGDGRDAATRRRRQAARRSRDAFAAAGDIGEIPAVVSEERKESCRLDLHRFLTTYFPESTGLRPFGRSQLDAIARVERCCLAGGRFLNAMPRGFVKSTIGENTVLWATLYGHRRYVVFFGATAEDADEAIKSVKKELQENDLLFDDFPEVCHAVRELEGKHQRCHSQTYRGVLTHIEWTAETVVLPTIPGSAAAGAIIRTKGLMAASRGMRYKRPDGKQARPDFVVIDDPQTDESAVQPAQVAKRLGTIRKSILRLGGHGKAVACVMNATVIAEGDAVDQLADFKRHPEWQAVRVAMMPRMPDALESFWLGPYADARRSYDRDDPDDQKRAHRDATALYLSRREEADAGAEVAWAEIPLEEGEASAIQHAMNILVDDGEEVFASECQNQPKRATAVSLATATEADVTGKTSGHKRRTLPEWSSHVVCMIDVHENIHYWTAAAVGSDFRGTVLDYGTFPEQPTRRFSQRGAKRTLRGLYSAASVEEAITRGVSDLVDELCGRDWKTTDGNVLPVSLVLVDTGHKPDQVAVALKRSRHAAVCMGSRGIGFGPLDKPMTEYDTSEEKVRRAGPNRRAPRWYVPRETRGGVQVVRFDATFWKDTLHARFLVPPGQPGEWTLFGDHNADHSLFAEHLTSQEPVPTTQKGRTVNLWKLRPGREDHWLDATVGCLVAASVLGCALPGHQPAKKAKRRKVRRGLVYANQG